MNKKIFSVVCATLSIFLISCSEQESSDTNSQERLQTENLLQLPNPITDFDTIDQAEKVVGFAVQTPHSIPLGYSQSQIQTIAEKTVQIFYKNGENQILFRQARGNEDISGDYNVYEQEQKISIGDVSFLLKGNDNKVNLATWQEGDYTYSMMVTPIENGLDIETFQKMISSVKE